MYISLTKNCNLRINLLSWYFHWDSRKGIYASGWADIDVKFLCFTFHYGWQKFSEEVKTQHLKVGGETQD